MAEVESAESKATDYFLAILSTPGTQQPSSSCFKNHNICKSSYDFPLRITQPYL